MDNNLTSKTPDYLAAEEALKRRQILLEYPGETPNVDYKAGVKFERKSDFSLKLIKHILGMANAGGGYIVIGYKENSAKHPEADTTITKDIISSYDPSSLASSVESYVVGSEKIQLNIYKDQHPLNSLVYPIIEVSGFKSRPFFCKSTSPDGVLKEGTLYIRVASARTIEVASPDEWDKLIDLCVERKQDSLMKRFSSFMQEAGFTPLLINSETEEKKTEQKWTKDNRKEFKEVLTKCELDNNVFYEATHFLTSSDYKLDVARLLEVAEKSMLRNTGWPVGVVLHNEGRPSPVEDGIKSIIDGARTADFWYLKVNGSFYFARSYEEEESERSRNTYPPRKNKPFFFDTRIWRIAEILLHCATLYKNMGVDPLAKVRVCITHHGIKDRELDASNFRRHVFPKIAGAEEAKWEKEISLDFLSSNHRDLTKEAARSLLGLFDFWNPEDSVLDEVINEFMGSRL